MIFAFILILLGDRFVSCVTAFLLFLRVILIFKSFRIKFSCIMYCLLFICFFS